MLKKQGKKGKIFEDWYFSIVLFNWFTKIKTTTGLRSKNMEKNRWKVGKKMVKNGAAYLVDILQEIIVIFG